MAINQARKQGQRAQINHSILSWDLLLGNESHDRCVFNEKRYISSIVSACSIEDPCSQKCLFHVRTLPFVHLRSPLVRGRWIQGQWQLLLVFFREPAIKDVYATALGQFFIGLTHLSRAQPQALTHLF